MSSLGVQDYHVGWICALNIELSAAIAMLDEEHEMMTGQDPQDHNSYVLGRIHRHNVVIAGMPEGVDGLVPAANVAKDMVRTFPGLRVGLMVGIGGGIPNLAKGIDIRLGDIVVSTPEKTRGGVVQYDKGKAEDGAKFVVKGQLNQPPALLLNALAQLRARHRMRPSRIMEYIHEAIRRNPMMEDSGFTLPSVPDSLFCRVCDADIEGPAANCPGFHTTRQSRKNSQPAVYYGMIASANQSVNDAAVRDRIRDEFHALCVEMEAAGLMNDFPCLVIRGICDYADKHENDAWREYAAITAAAYTKEFLQYIIPAQAQLQKPIQDIMTSLEQHSAKQSRLAEDQLYEVQREHEKQDRRYLNDQHGRCHRTFKTTNYERLKEFNPDRVEGTCHWVLSDPQYRQWHTNPHDGLLWISADPGCGKSVLAKSLVDHEHQNTDQHTACHFFFKDNGQDHVATALCALLHQLFSHQPWLIPHAIPAWEKTGDEVVKEEAELWRILLSAATADDAHNVTCVLDALDECRPSDRRWLIDMLSRFHAEASVSPSSSRRGRLKFLVTSRPYDDIRAEFQKTVNDLPTIRLRGEEKNEQIHREIDLVIRMRVEQLARDLLLDSDTKSQLETKLLQMEHRTYLWLHLAIQDIRVTYRNSLRLGEASIKSLPSSVEDAYERILSRVHQEQRGIVKNILQIVVGARRPLTIGEMAIALEMVRPDQPKSLHSAKVDPTWLQSRIRDWCGLFIFINHDRIYLIHQTAKEFLVSHPDFVATSSGWRHCLHPRLIQKEMTRICVGFLLMKEVAAIAEPLFQNIQRDQSLDCLLENDNPLQSLFVYSAEHWPSHFRESYLPRDDSVVLQARELYNVNGKFYNLWFPIFWWVTGRDRHSDIPADMSSIRLGGLLGHDNILELILQRIDRFSINECINECDTARRTALLWASEGGYEKVVQMLLDHGANVNPGERFVFNTALQAASAYGREKVVQMLLDRGADVNTKGDYYGTALQAASIDGHEKIVQILLDHGADVNTKGGIYNTALQAASLGGHEKVVQILLGHHADVNIEGGYSSTALQAASANGSEKVVQILLDHGADVNIEGDHGDTALQAASERGYEKVVQILLDHGADVNIEGRHHSTALRAASLSGREKVVQILLDHGADINIEGDYGTALRAASAWGREKVVQILLDHGADVNIEGEHGTALQAASQGGHEKVVQMLLDHGANINTKRRRRI